MLCGQLQWSSTIERRWKVSLIWAMSEAVCHDNGLAYDLSIKLNMQLANGEVDQSLGLSCNIPCKINTITLYLKIHIIRLPAYDILLG
jgi:hypothetical protein